MMNAALCREERQRVLSAQRQYLADILALEQDTQGFRIEALTAADIAEHLHIRQETHFNTLHALAFASFAAATRRIEGKAAGGEATHARLGCIREQAANGIPESDVGRGAGPRRLTDGGLIDLEHPADRLPTCNSIASLKQDVGFGG